MDHVHTLTYDLTVHCMHVFNILTCNIPVWETVCCNKLQK